jgi:leucyl aminopeptidase
VRVTTTTQPGAETDADTIAIGVFEGEESPAGAPEEASELLRSGEAQRSLKSLGLTHAQGKRWLVLGLGKRVELTPERARVLGATVHARALEVGARTLCMQTPTGAELTIAAGLVEGMILADYRYDQYKSTPNGDAGSGDGNGNGGGLASTGGRQGGGDGEDAGSGPPKHLQALIVSAPDAPGGADELERHVREAALVAEAANAARDLQNRPANDLTPTALGEYAVALAGEIEGLSAEFEGRDGLRARGMGAFAAVAQGSYEEPALIVMRYEPHGGGDDAPVLGLVGKAVTFDSGGISLKPGAKMAEMKFDMSGGAAVVEAVAAIARLRLPVRVVAVVGATENLPSGRSVKPGDIVTAANGKTIEVNNTDAEGRLVLADCLCHAVGLGAQRIVDLATLTGAVIIALGSTYAGVIGNDDEFVARISDAGSRSGEICWRLPLHEEYDELIKGTYADLDNAPEGRKAGTIVGGAFLQNFVGETPWAHLDIAGSAWDLGRAYVGKGASGYGVRLLVELARSYCA